MEDNADILEGLEERLHKHSAAFESLLALTPARHYYGSQIDDGLDPSEQWNRKKQTKEQKQAAKKAKLDPANQKSALDVMKERERKRKRELGMDDDDDDENSVDAVEDAKPKKKAKVEPTEEEEKRAAKAEKRRMKREAKKEKSARKKAKAEAKKAAKQDLDLAEAQAEKKRAAPTLKAREPEEDDDEDDEEQAEEMELGGDFGNFDASGLSEAKDAEMDGVDEEDGDEQASEASSAPSTPALDSPAFDVDTNRSAASSSSSIVPPSVVEQPAEPDKPKQAPPKPKVNTDIAQPAAKDTAAKRMSPPSGTSSPKMQLPDIDQAQLQERLRQRIEELRARRKADGPDGKPAKSRQELLDQRRKKDEQRKAAKKEHRRKQKEDEQRKQEEQLRASSGSPMSMDMFSPRPQPRSEENSFSFSRLAFEDGTAADASLTSLADPRKKKGPQDPRTALEAAQNKQKRISGLDAEKRNDIAEKDMWLNAKKRAHGERVRDDTSLLKKALKRKEKQKGKSGEQWRERQEAVVKGREMKQKKREANLAKRKEEKGGKGAGGGGGKKKGRAGFEGRFKA